MDTDKSNSKYNGFRDNIEFEVYRGWQRMSWVETLKSVLL